MPETVVILKLREDGTSDFIASGNRIAALGLLEFAKVQLRFQLADEHNSRTAALKPHLCECGHAAFQHDAVGCIVTTDPGTNEHCPCAGFKEAEHDDNNNKCEICL
jgi:hypothetical protein